MIVRSVGRDTSDVPAQPAHRDLVVMFMASEPQGEQALDHDAEESAILAATERLALTLSVEEADARRS